MSQSTKKPTKRAQAKAPAGKRAAAKSPAKRLTLNAKGKDTRQRVLAKAAELFAKRGYDGIGLQEIGTSCGMTKGTLFWHFKNKRHLYTECVTEAVAAALSEVDTAITETPPKAQLRQYLEWLLPALSKNALVRRLLLHIVIDKDSQLIRELMHGPMGRSYETFMHILDRLKPKNDKIALSFFAYAIFVLNDELIELADVWAPATHRHVGGKKSITFIETLVKSW
jgi:AcrR family transcriptional regulator